MPLNIIVGTQWGDEGKGRVVDLLSAQADFVARFNGGDNAGHTVTVGGHAYKLHLVPSGVIHPKPVGVIGNGVVLSPEILIKEIDTLRAAGVIINPQRLRISYAAHLITPAHRALDLAQEMVRGQTAIGTTLRGIGPAYANKVTRQGIRVEAMLDQEGFADAIKSHVDEVNQLLSKLYNTNLLDSNAIAAEFTGYAQQLTPYIADVSSLLSDAIKRGERVLAEGAQGTLLDLDHGTYPFVTSSNPTAPGALVGLGLGVKEIGRVIGVTKAFQTRVGAGPFPTELTRDIASRLRGSGANPWDEYGTTTGRPRRVGWLDLVLLRYAARVNGLTELVITKLDILTGLHPIRICTSYNRKGSQFQELPLGPGELSGFEPVYKDFHGWDEDVRTVRKINELPDDARAYIRFIEEACDVSVSMISVGPERDQMIVG
jgi:adenylosuccinate synthase